MTKLETEIKKLKSELDDHQTGEQNRVVIKEVTSGYEDLHEVYEKLDSVRNQRKALQALPRFFSFDGNREEEGSVEKMVRVALEKALSVWEENPVNIRQSGAVGELIEALNSCKRLLMTNNKQHWIKWREDKAREFAIFDAELDSVKAIPDYKKPIDRYVWQKKNFIDQSKNVPETKVEIEILDKISEELKAIKKTLKFDLPEFVLSFYNTLDQKGLFPLGEINQDLFEWLKKNGELKNLVIRRRGI